MAAVALISVTRVPFSAVPADEMDSVAKCVDINQRKEENVRRTMRHIDLQPLF